ncbi:hypothetical protein O181_070654 [Austropuccinia psidii MF-1]|uniref:Uncharacterized protein n=1 Tax=Austropuccinia psidii MF-1 TaxID=1389203 RepID=A0A9Q3F190_9BASI|nr:hypothetical protein [Austropuccinia psidii MF-1]
MLGFIVTLFALTSVLALILTTHPVLAAAYKSEAFKGSGSIQPELSAPRPWVKSIRSLSTDSNPQNLSPPTKDRHQKYKRNELDSAHDKNLQKEKWAASTQSTAFSNPRPWVLKTKQDDQK